MSGGRNYTFTLRAGKDGTQYLLIHEAQPARRALQRRWPARHAAWALAMNMNGLKASFQKVFRFGNRRA